MFTSEVLSKQTGEKIAPAFKTRAFKGSYKKIKVPGYDCKISNALAIPPTWKCTAEKRVIIPGSSKRHSVSKAKVGIGPGQTVKIAKISRDQLSLKSVNWSKILPEHKNPNSERFRPTALSRVYPYETLITRVKSPKGFIDFNISSERIGLPRAFAISTRAAIGASGVFWGGAAGLAALETGFFAIPIAGVVGGIFAGVTALMALPAITALDQKSGLLVLPPMIRGDYKISYKTKLRFGNIYKDLYITISPKEEVGK